MTSKSTQRNPLLIPLIVVLVIAIVAIALLFMRSNDLSSQVTALNDQVTGLNTTVESLIGL